MVRKLFIESGGIPNLDELSNEFNSKLLPFERTSSLWQVSENRDSNEDSINMEGRKSTFYSFE